MRWRYSSGTDMALLPAPVTYSYSHRTVNANTLKYISLLTLTLQNAILGLSMRYARTRPGDIFLSSTGECLSKSPTGRRAQQVKPVHRLADSPRCPEPLPRNLDVGLSTQAATSAVKANES